MKFFLALLAVVALVAAEGDWDPTKTMDPYNAIQAECIEESGLTPRQMEQIAAFEYPDEDEIHKFILCMAWNLGVFDGPRFSLYRISNAFDVSKPINEKIERTLNECMDSTAEVSTPQNWAYRGFQCMLQSEIGAVLKEAMQAEARKSY